MGRADVQASSPLPVAMTFSTSFAYAPVTDSGKPTMLLETSPKTEGFFLSLAA
jgi:hypothetical protein